MTHKITTIIATAAQAAACLIILCGCESSGEESDADYSTDMIQDGMDLAVDNSFEVPVDGTAEDAALDDPVQEQEDLEVIEDISEEEADDYTCGPTGTITREVMYGGVESRTYWLYIPTNCDSARPIPVLLAFHGSGDTSANYIQLWTITAERENFIVVAQEGEDNMGWGYPSDVPVLELIIDDVFEAYDADENRFYITGFSAGGHWTYSIGLYNADLFAAMGVQAGSMSYILSNPDWRDHVVRQIPVDIHHGTGDTIVPIGHAEQARDTLTAMGHTVFFHSFSGGHTTTREHADEIWANIGGLTLLD